MSIRIDGVELVGIASVSNKCLKDAGNALNANGIGFFGHGSRLFGIYVLPDDVDRAKEILQHDAQSNKYQILWAK